MKLWGVEGERDTAWSIKFDGDGWRAYLSRTRGSDRWYWTLRTERCKIDEPFHVYDDAIEAAKALTAAVKRLGLRVGKGWTR